MICGRVNLFAPTTACNSSDTEYAVWFNGDLRLAPALLALAGRRLPAALLLAADLREAVLRLAALRALGALRLVAALFALLLVLGIIFSFFPIKMGQ